MTRKARIHVNVPKIIYGKTRRVHHHRNHHAPRSALAERINHNLQHILRRNIRIPAFRKHISPGHDFYSHVNGDWIRSTSIPSYTSTFGVSEEVESHIEGLLLREINRCRAVAEEGSEQGTEEGMIRDAIGRLVMSSMRPGEQKHSIEYLKKGVRGISCMRDQKDLSTTLGSLCRFRIPTILSINILPIQRGGYTVSLSPGRVGLPDTTYYSGTVPGKTNVLYSYTSLIQRITTRIDVDDASKSIPFEARFSGLIHSAESDTSTTDMRVSELVRRFRNIDWMTLLTSFGLPEKGLANMSIHIDSETFLKELNRECKETPIQIWQGLFSLHTILHALPYLPPPFDDWHFAFYGHLLRGQRKKVPQDILTLNIVEEQMAPALGYLFVKKYLTPEFKTQATRFVRKIVDSAEKRMGGVEWFTPATRRAAAEKLRRAELSVAWSEPLVKHPPHMPALQTDTLLANIYLLEESSTERQIQYLVSSRPPKGVWEESPYSVNAYYYHDTNELVIPAGSFFWPFYRNEHEKGSVGWNFGGLGAVIAHEITHAFDAEGKEYGPRGDEGAWWTAEDEKAYAQKTKALIELFGAKKILGRSVDGVLTMNENLADLGGLAIAMDALKQEIAGLSEAEKGRHMREFFISYAVSWRTKEHKERRLQRLITDKHAPIELRVNLIVSQFEEWYQAFGVRTGDALYIPPEERIRVF